MSARRVLVTIVQDEKGLTLSDLPADVSYSELGAVLEVLGRHLVETYGVPAPRVDAVELLWRNR